MTRYSALLPLWLAFTLLAPARSVADARCGGPPTARAARFSAKALPGKSERERLDAYLAACGRDEVVRLTQQLVAFKTVSAERPKTDGEFAAMGRFLDGWARSHGMSFRKFGKDDIFELSWGKADAPLLLGWVFHGDVVPANPREWTVPTFTAKVSGNRLSGRGVDDDKGPLAAAMVALSFARDLGMSPRGRVLLVIGNGEEHAWEPMMEYAKSQPHPPFVISVDSSFPVVVAQSGFVAWQLTAPAATVPSTGPTSAIAEIADASAGEFLTQVPGHAELTLRPLGGLTPAQLEAKVTAAIEETAKSRAGLKTAVARQKDVVVLSTKGRAVHSSEADAGHNALWDLAAVASHLALARSGTSELLGAVARSFDGDHWGEKLGLAQRDDLMGRLLVAPTVLKTQDGVTTLSVNLRRPRGMEREAFVARLEAAAKQLGKESGGLIAQGKELYVGDPHLADVRGPLVTTLLDVYRRRSSDPHAAARAIRGGTYARLFPGAVDFGPSWPGQEYSGHAPDESTSIEHLHRTTLMLGEVLHILAISGEVAPPVRQ